MKSANDVILATALPSSEGTRRSDSSLAGIEPEHDFTKTYGIKFTIFFVFEI